MPDLAGADISVPRASYLEYAILLPHLAYFNHYPSFLSLPYLPLNSESITQLYTAQVAQLKVFEFTLVFLSSRHSHVHKTGSYHPQMYHGLEVSYTLSCIHFSKILFISSQSSICMPLDLPVNRDVPKFLWGSLLRRHDPMPSAWQAIYVHIPILIPWLAVVSQLTCCGVWARWLKVR